MKRIYCYEVSNFGGNPSAILVKLRENGFLT